MNSLLQHIRQNTQTPTGLTLVIGAGNGASLPALRQLGSSRLVLVEAHPRQAEELARRARMDLGEEVWHQAITATAQGNVTLHVLNNPNYNSLMSPSGLLTYFPNLRAISNLEAPSRTLTESITALSPAVEDDNLLILDAPGQALELLKATSPSALQSFAWIIINGAVETLYSGGSTAIESAYWLQKLGFDPVSEDQEALYPHTSLLLVRNPTRVETYRLDTEIRQLYEQLDQCQHAQVHEAEDYRQKLDQLGQHSDEQTRRLSERQNQLDALTSENTELIAARDALNKEKAVLIAARDEQTKLAAERKTQLDALSSEKTELIAARDALNKEKAVLIAARDEQTKLAAERKTQLDALSSEKTELIAARDVLDKEKAVLTAARDEQTKLANERKTQLDALSSEKTELIAARDVLDKEKGLLTAARDEQTKLANERKTQLDALTSEKTELIAARDALNKEKAVLTAARDEQTKLAEERKTQMDKVSLEHSKVQCMAAEQKRNFDALQQKLMTQQQLIKHQEAESKESNLRHIFMQEELIKAEAQVELIKDLLLREPGL